MKKFFLLFFLISNLFSPLCALEIKKYLQQSFPFLRQELRTVSAVPPSLIENEYIPYHNVSGERLHRLSLETGVSVAALLSDNLEVLLSYDGSFREDYNSNTGSLKLRYMF